MPSKLYSRKPASLWYHLMAKHCLLITLLYTYNMPPINPAETPDTLGQGFPTPYLHCASWYS